ncbi:helix-turn-helix domain-containing protein [Brevibacillus borstelensis]|uniref:helix-turn-helix domain-containing protein n=1 Tax=Brevibacillus borstelensis TaxID=45462 RepID=UPI00203C4E37|nr:helix-turn-helix domain-containing protein [Brevibacillus borstelensis]MCM3591245.1 helix-turn-helix domain-containing protein [Brevibacillus borstelensis]
MKQIKVFNRVPHLEDWVIDKQVEKQVRFLKAVHPQLADEHWNEGRVELRPVKRDPNLKDYLRSFGSWHLGEKDVTELKKFLNAINGKGVDLYFSAYAFDYGMDVFKKDGKKYEKGKINNENALFTSILPMDFDNITAEEFLIEKQRLMDLGIETIDIMSGHGYQSFILLSHKVTDKDIFKKFTTLMLSKGFKVDEAVQDPARVLRMPYSFNCKALDKNTKYYDPMNPRIIATTDISWTERRYHVTKIFEKLNRLPDVIMQSDRLTDVDVMAIPVAPLTNTERKAEKEKAKREIEEVKQIKVETLKAVYSMIDFERLPLPIQKMLAGSQEGLRNKVMIFIIPFLRNSLGLNIQTIKQIMTLWGERCKSALDADFVNKETDRIYKLGFKGKHGHYTEELRKAYGYLEFDKYTKRNKIIIPNGFFEDMSTMSDGAVRIFLAMKLGESLNGVKNFSKADIQKYAQVSERTMERNIKDLLSKGHVCKRRGNRRNGEGHVYYTNPYFNSVAGFTMLENATVKLMLSDLKDGEIKLYCFLSKIVGDSRAECWTSQKYLANKIGKKGHDSISKMTGSLHEKGFITKKTIEKNGVKHSVYNLNY